MAPPKMGTAASHWFYRGMVVGIMIMATFNAISLFVRTHGWGGLLGHTGNMEAIGFPLEFWRLGEYYGGYVIDLWPFAINAVVGLALGSIIGLLAISQMYWLNPMVEELHQRSLEKEYKPFQFSIGTLMLATIPVAVLFAAARTGRYEVLAGIYLAGPTVLIVMAMMPHGLSWDTRVILLTPMAISLIGFAMWIGASIGIDFDRVLMGIFACWVPQSAMGAIGMAAVILFKEYRRFKSCPESTPAA